LLAKDILEHLAVVKTTFEWFDDEQIQKTLKNKSSKPLWWTLRFSFADKEGKERIDYLTKVLSEDWRKAVCNEEKNIASIQKILKEIKNEKLADISDATKKSLDDYVKWYVSETKDREIQADRTEKGVCIFGVHNRIFENLNKLKTKDGKEIYLLETYLGMTDDELAKLDTLCSTKREKKKRMIYVSTGSDKVKDEDLAKKAKLLKIIFGRVGYAFKDLKENRKDVLDIVLDTSTKVRDKAGKLVSRKPIHVLADFLQQVDGRGINHYREKADKFLSEGGGGTAWVKPVKTSIKKRVKAGKHLYEASKEVLSSGQRRKR